MFGLGAATWIYLAPGATDMRKGFNALYGLVRDARLTSKPRWPDPVHEDAKSAILQAFDRYEVVGINAGVKGGIKVVQ